MTLEASRACLDAALWKRSWTSLDTVRVSATLGFSSRTSIEKTEVQWKTLGVTKTSRATAILGYQTDHLCLTSN